MKTKDQEASKRLLDRLKEAPTTSSKPDIQLIKKHIQNKYA
ncbi:hypothetical protein [Mongoliitalea daihaiensis]|nr:hypothetical protein [Mongoliitalea daihaiensis]